MDERTRRTVLRSGAATIALAGVAGCLGGGGDGGGGLTGDDYPDIDEWLTETTVGDADDTYDGTLVDRRDRSSLEIDVGAPGNGGNLAFAPSAVAIPPGATVTWVWTGQGGPHNVEAEPEDQIDASDYEYSSGEAVETAGTDFTFTFEDAGIALYHCEPHLSLGMKGGIAVAEP